MMLFGPMFSPPDEPGRPLLVETLFQMLAKGISPRVPEKGSVGASGDLAPLAHLALGSWVKASVSIRIVGCRVAKLSECRRRSVRLAAKEGLAL